MPESWHPISEMGYVAIQTDKVEASLSDAEDLLGLRITHTEGRRTYLAAADVHHELVYVDAGGDALDRIGLVAADAAALRALHSRLVRDGFEIIEAQAWGAGVDEGFSFIGPEGFVFEIYVGMARRGAGRIAGAPDRFGHVNLHPRDAITMRNFLVSVLGFRVSDVIGDGFGYFLRCNPDHHGIALITGQGRLHHHAWQTQSIADLARLADKLNSCGRRLIWGPVRHGAGHNIAAYFVEPAGSVIELYTDLEQIYDDARPPIKWGADENWFNLWGVYAGEDFRSHGLAPIARVPA